MSITLKRVDGIKTIFRVMVRETEAHDWSSLFISETFEGAEKIIEAHYKEYYYFKIEKMYCGEAYHIDSIVG